jgi:ADP-ribose pyrophosphatase YjhB (NUDIX family)
MNEKNVALGLIMRPGRIFLAKRPVRENGMETGENFWALPGGHVEPGEDPQAAFEREMREEIIDANVLFIWKLGAHEMPPKKFHIFLAYVSEKDAERAHAEKGAEHVWIRPEDRDSFWSKEDQKDLRIGEMAKLAIKLVLELGEALPKIQHLLEKGAVINGGKGFWKGFFEKLSAINSSESLAS